MMRIMTKPNTVHAYKMLDLGRFIGSFIEILLVVVIREQKASGCCL